MNLRGSTVLILGLILLLTRSGQTVPVRETVNVTENPQLNAFSEAEILTGQRVANWHPGMKVNPEELGEYFEGDIRTSPYRKDRSMIRDRRWLWPNGVVPYEIISYFNNQEYNNILDAMHHFHQHTCIRFVPVQQGDYDYIRITAVDSGCWSEIGRQSGRQDVNLQLPGCLTNRGTVIHELMHAIGFVHEHNREDRDNYVDILFANVMQNQTHNFVKAVYGTTTDLGVNYDYGSVMHYSSHAFSYNGQPTIVPNRRGISLNQLGQRYSFSNDDIVKINRLYNCNRRPASSTSSHVAWPQP